MVGTGLCLTYIMILLLQRSHRQADLKRIEEESKRALQDANELLESRVSDRTQKLTETNECYERRLSIENRQRSN